MAGDENGDMNIVSAGQVVKNLWKIQQKIGDICESIGCRLHKTYWVLA